ncbi:MAG TPA: hypothetical protein PKU93_00530 [Candidatus Pacearchaeota archaeon]|nr:hypothetical protein [Candidatus Pacearchaeota archaeon]
MPFNPYNIKTIDDFLKNQALIRRFFRFINLSQNISEVNPETTYIFSIKEQCDYLVHSLSFAKIITNYDWDEKYSPTIGRRYIRFEIKGNKLLEVYNRVYGNNGFIKRETLELISKDISTRIDLDKLYQLLTEELKIPETMFDVESNVEYTIFYILSYFSTSISEEDNGITIKIINRLLHPLFFKNEDEAQKTFNQYKNWLKFDNIQMDYNDIVPSPGSKKKNLQPYTLIEKGIGYLKLYKEGEKIKIAKTETRRFKLMQAMLISIGLERNIHVVFENIKIEDDESWCPEDDTYHFDEKTQIIKDTLRRLRQIKGLEGKIRCRFNKTRKTVRFDIV